MKFNLRQFETEIARAVLLLRENGIVPTDFIVVPSVYQAIWNSIEARENTTLAKGAQIYIEGVPCVVSEVTQH